MISGLFVRHYGIYKNINYIPLSNSENFTSIIGENGTGKSTILDALDKFLNKKDPRDWPINKLARLEGGISSADKIPFIAPVFLIKKEELNLLPDEALKVAKVLSYFFWNISKRPQLEDFFAHREQLKNEGLEQTHLLFILGKNIDIKDVFFFSFESEITNFYKKNLPDIDFKKRLLELLERVVDLYTYLYIPVETNVGSFTKLETNNMQVLMDKNIQDAVGKTITQKSVDEINLKLNKFLGEIEALLPDYSYKALGKKNKLTKLDITQKTIEAFFATKVLHKKTNKTEISIDGLSSGEKRRALIDLAYSFLVKEGIREKKVILAIDEPESSLHIDVCFEQFEKLQNISENNIHILLTTHWYGHLPVSSRGKSVLLSKKNGEIEKYHFDLSNYREHIAQSKKNGTLPFSIQLKSYNDLTQSIISSLQSGYKWIICEGSSEKIYFDHYFDTKSNKKLKILPAGGAAEVLRIARYLSTPLQDKSLSPSGKILCLIDTDREDKKFNTDNAIKCLQVKRLIRVKDVIKLVDIEHTEKNPETEIEDALSAKPYIETLISIAPENIKNLITPASTRESADTSAYALDLKESERELLTNYFDSTGVKYTFAKKYVEICQSNRSPAPLWISDIRTALDIEAHTPPKKDSLEQHKPTTTSTHSRKPTTRKITRTRKKTSLTDKTTPIKN